MVLCSNSFLHQLSLLWHPGVAAETLWCSESYHNLTYHLCSFVTSQEVKGAWTALAANMCLFIDQMYRVQFVASFEQFRLSVVGSDRQHCLK